MSISVLKGENVPIHMWAEANEVESVALDQLKNIAALPWVRQRVAVMPDCHLGKGATVGSVIAMKDAIAPSAVGVDIGCGVNCVKTSLKLHGMKERKLKALYSRFEETVPVGFAKRDGPVPEAREAKALWEEFPNLHPLVQDRHNTALNQLGSLGGGNHFVEVNPDDDGNIWLMLHSGSRNIGKEIAEVHIWEAKKLEHNTHLPDRELSVFLAGTPGMQSYRHDLFWAQEYARLNREIMVKRLCDVIREEWPAVTFETPISCHHNYVSEEVHDGEELLVTRKGAISARLGELGIIPGAMGARSYIVRGKGNPESFCSASHGAGRKMSRSKAKQKFTIEDLRESMKGVIGRTDKAVIDEIMGAYKKLDKVMAQQADLVEVVVKLHKALLVMKG
jgi:tRNA-splicing ligase RtcB